MSSALFNPRSVALVGASGDPAKATSRVQQYLVRHGYRGSIYPVNPRYEEVEGHRCYPSLAQLPEAPL